MSKSVKNSIIYSFVAIASQLISLSIYPMITRILSPVDFGMWAMSLAFGSFTSGLSVLGFTAIYDRNYYDKTSTTNEYTLLLTYIFYTIMTSLIWTIIILIFGKFFSLFLYKEPTFIFPILLGHILSCSTRLQTFFLSYYKNEEKAKSYAYLNIGTILLVTFGSLLFTVILGFGFMGYIISQTIINSFVVLCCLTYFIFKSKAPLFDFQLCKKSFKQALPLTPTIFTGVINSQFDKYLIGLISTLGGVGIYTMGQRFSYFVFFFMTALGNVFQPKTYKMMFAENSIKQRKKIGQMLTPYFYLSSILALGVTAFSKEILIIVTSEQFYSAWPIIIILSNYYLILFFAKQNQLLYANKMGLSSILSFIQLGATIGANILFIHIYGALGAAIGTYVGGFIGLSISFFFSQRAYKILFDYKIILTTLSYIYLSSLIVFHLNSLEYKLIHLTIKISLCGGLLLIGYYFNLFKNVRQIISLVSFKK